MGRATEGRGECRLDGLGRRCAPLGDQPGDGTLGDVDPQFQELTMDSGGAPERIRGGHSYDEGLDLSIDGWAARDGPGGELGPVLAEAAPLPPQDGVG